MKVITKKILVADDDPVMFKLIKVRLIKRGYEVYCASNGKDAVEIASLHKPHLILMDFKMPIMNGLEAIGQIKKDEDLKNVPIILMTSGASGFRKENVKALGVDAFLMKPFRAAELISTVESILK